MRGCPRVAQLRCGPITGPTRSGLSVVSLEHVRDAVLTVIGLDAINGTPVLDIKPYVPHYDSVPAARLPAWQPARRTASRAVRRGIEQEPRCSFAYDACEKRARRSGMKSVMDAMLRWSQAAWRGPHPRGGRCCHRRAS